MINQELLRNSTVVINMKQLNKAINTKAIFNQKDVRTGVMTFQLTMDSKPIDLTNCTIVAEILKPDNKTIIQKCQLIEAQSGLIALGLTLDLSCCYMPEIARCL